MFSFRIYFIVVSWSCIGSTKLTKLKKKKKRILHKPVKNRKEKTGCVLDKAEM